MFENVGMARDVARGSAWGPALVVGVGETDEEPVIEVPPLTRICEAVTDGDPYS